MTFNACAGRITGPVPYVARNGGRQNIPLGPCVIEQSAGPNVDIVWGRNGQYSTELPIQVIKDAAESGNLVLLD